MPAASAQPGVSAGFPRNRTEAPPQVPLSGGTSSVLTSTLVYEEPPKASAGCTVRGFLEDRWPNGSLG